MPGKRWPSRAVGRYLFPYRRVCAHGIHRNLYQEEKNKLGGKQQQPKQQQEAPKPRQAGVPVNASPLGPLKKEVGI